MLSEYFLAATARKDELHRVAKPKPAGIVQQFASTNRPTGPRIDASEQSAVVEDGEADPDVLLLEEGGDGGEPQQYI